MATKKSARGKSAAGAKSATRSNRKTMVKKGAVLAGRVAKRTASKLLDIAEKKIHRAAEQARAREKKSSKNAAPAPKKAAAAPKKAPAARKMASQRAGSPAKILRRTEQRKPQIRRVARPSTPVPDADVHTPSQVSFRGPLDQRTKADPKKIRGAEKILNEQFNEEDEYTNKSGDPRIGTHGRKYVP
jgi:hypothetical protein